MQIQKTQNGYNANFGAQLQLKNAKEFPKKFVYELALAAKKVGSDSDIIALNFGNVYKKSVDGYQNTVNYYRDVHAASFINGDLNPEKLTADYDGVYVLNFQDEQKRQLKNLNYLKTEITKYFHKLSHKNTIII